MSTAQPNILVPIDLSEQSLIALSQSYNLARLNNADITLLHVIEEDNSLFFFAKKSSDEQKKMEKQIKEKLNSIADEGAKLNKVRIHVMVSRGKIYEEIVAVAEKINAIFIIMGTNGSVGFKKFIGSNTLRIVRESKCPVITIKGKTHRAGCKNIVLPLDLSRETKEKVNKAIEIAKDFNSDIRIVTIITTDDEFLVKKLNRQLNQVQDFVREKGVSCSAEVLKGNSVADEVVKYSKKIDADLIMIMTQEETEWTTLFIGSQAQQVINNSDVPVLSIRPSEKADKTVFTPY